MCSRMTGISKGVNFGLSMSFKPFVRKDSSVLGIPRIERSHGICAGHAGLRILVGEVTEDFGLKSSLHDMVEVNWNGGGVTVLRGYLFGKPFLDNKLSNPAEVGEVGDGDRKLVEDLLGKTTRLNFLLCNGASFISTSILPTKQKMLFKPGMGEAKLW